jgi:3-oxoacyl-[acyl-carrier protein] reductase
VILKGRIAIVTGASSGIGRACAVRFAEEGAAVVVCARRLDRLQELAHEIEAAGGSAVAIRCDVAVEADIDGVVDATIDRFGRVDVLANIAQGGMGHLGPLAQTTTKDLLEMFLTGPVASMLFMQKCFPHMKAQGYGRIINCGSATSLLGAPGVAGYNMAKEAILALTRTAAKDWAQYGLVTNTFLPAVRSEAVPLSEEFYEQLAATSPLRRYGYPYEDCAPIVAFMASEEAGYLNGQAIGIDGGRTLIA